MSNYNEIKNRLNNESAKESIINLLKESKIINVVINNEIYLLDYLLQDSNNYIFIPKPLLKSLEKEIFGVITFDNKRGKVSKQIRFKFNLEKVESLNLEDPILKKKTAKGVNIFKMININAKAILDSINQFSFNDNLEVTFSKYDLYNKERYEHSRLICLSYLEKEFVLNVVVENNEYYALTKSDSNKINHIKNNGNFTCYDGINNSFNCSIEILDNKYVEEIFNKLDSTNNNYFKETTNLIAIKVYKI